MSNKKMWQETDYFILLQFGNVFLCAKKQGLVLVASSKQTFNLTEKTKSIIKKTVFMFKN